MKTAFLILFAGLSLVSCGTLGIPGIPSGRGWSLSVRNKRGTAETGTIRVDKTADWDSVEDEARRLLPLLLAEAGYEPPDAPGAPGTAGSDGVSGSSGLRVEAVLIEREYMENWKTRRSLSAEILVFKNGGEAPAAMGKALLGGSKSLSSSEVLHDLLKRALAGALEALGNP
ncbi:MAG: hypothetical protein LBD09_02105 [Treponema sp.]|jgi:hypothetical protein|nr:hypothetical protein [Treponema sp.]